MANASKSKNAKPAASDTILSVAVELLAVGIFTLLAGVDQISSIVVIFMLGLWLLYVITNSTVLSDIVGSLTKVAG